MKVTPAKRAASRQARATPDHGLPGQVVLVLQGGGALGAYQVGVYQALHEAGLEPQWIIGTSIGAINGAIIAGNPPSERMDRLERFWDRMQHHGASDLGAWWPGLGNALTNAGIVGRGIAGFFEPNPQVMWGMQAPLGVSNAAFYSTEPLGRTLAELVDFDYINARHVRLTLGAVNVGRGEMRYFDNREQVLDARHVMASGALPPAFPAVRIDGEAYWDGGIYSNTPIEAVLDDKPRRNSLIFSANVWHPQGAEPESLAQVLARLKDVQYASRYKSHVTRQQQIHRMRHIVRDLGRHMTDKQRAQPEVHALLAYGCSTVMHVVPLFAPRVENEDHTKDIDFSRAGIKARRDAGYVDTRRRIGEAPWRHVADAMDGVIVHEND